MADPALDLDRDGAVTAPGLQSVLAELAGETPEKQALAKLILCVAEACIPLARRLARGNLPGDPRAIVGTNDSGDRQKALDMAAHHHLLDAFRRQSVAHVLSEEADAVIALDPDGRFDVAMDPIDGSGSIGIGAPLGALFAIFPAGDSFLRPGRDIMAAAYVSFGHSVDLGFSMGGGVSIATFDPESGQYFVDERNATLPDRTSTVAFNASNVGLWSAGLQAYADDLIHGSDGPRGRDFNMRWLAAAVGDLHRILRQGGMFLYPADRRSGYENGFLRLAYEAFPIAFLIEQAGGQATDGRNAILDLSPTHPHDRVPLVFGCSDEVDALRHYLASREN